MKEKETNSVIGKERLEQISRIVILCILCCALMGAMLALYQNHIPNILEQFEEEGKMEHTAWFVEYASFLPPVILVAVLITVGYSFGCTYVPIRTQYDKAIIVGVTFAFTYFVLLTSSLLSSPGWNIPTDEAEKVKTAFEICAPWFFSQFIPFVILLSYHLVRASSEKKELCDNE